MTVNVIRSIMFFILLAFSSTLTTDASAQPGCIAVPHAAENHAHLNAFWGTAIPLCALPSGANNAYANRSYGVVLADQDWLDYMASQYGNWAATGILAHEWGHMVQGSVSGTAAELQADCLAGVFMRGVGLAPATVTQFAQANWDSGDSNWHLFGHGTPHQRASAALRGYNGFVPGMNVYHLTLLCPLSAF